MNRRILFVQCQLSHMCLLLRDFSDRCEGVTPYFFHNPYNFYYEIFYNARPHCCIIAELTILGWQ